MFEESPNGHFINDLIVFNSLNTGGYVSKGFIFEPPDMINAQVSELNEFQDQLSLLMQSITENQRLQIQYYCDSDYRHELLRYILMPRLKRRPTSGPARSRKRTL